MSLFPFISSGLHCSCSLKDVLLGEGLWGAAVFGAEEAVSAKRDPVWGSVVPHCGWLAVLSGERHWPCALEKTWGESLAWVSYIYCTYRISMRETDIQLTESLILKHAVLLKLSFSVHSWWAVFNLSSSHGVFPKDRGLWKSAWEMMICYMKHLMHLINFCTLLSSWYIFHYSSNQNVWPFVECQRRRGLWKAFIKHLCFFMLGWE